MSELKTLKDMEGMDAQEFTGKGEDFPWKHIDDLREEAIKWHKNINKKCDKDCGCYCENGCYNVCGFIETFFNITSEDLEDG